MNFLVCFYCARQSKFGCLKLILRYNVVVFCFVFFMEEPFVCLNNVPLNHGGKWIGRNYSLSSLFGNKFVCGPLSACRERVWLHTSGGVNGEELPVPGDQELRGRCLSLRRLQLWIFTLHS